MDKVTASFPQQKWDQLIPNNPVPSPAKERVFRTLPRGLRFCVWMDNDEGETAVTMRKGIFAATEFKAGAWFGPYEGSILLPSGGGAKSEETWEIYCSGRLCHYLDGSNDQEANWMRYVRCSKEPGPQVNLLAYQHFGSVYYHSFTVIAPGQELRVCLRHFKLEEGLDGLRDEPRVCSVCKCTLPSRALPAVRYTHKVVTAKKQTHRAKTAISPDSAATKRRALNSKIDKLRQKLKAQPSEASSATSTRLLEFGTSEDHFASGRLRESTGVNDSKSSRGTSANTKQQEQRSQFSLKTLPSQSCRELRVTGESSGNLTDSSEVHPGGLLRPYDPSKATSEHSSGKAHEGLTVLKAPKGNEHCRSGVGDGKHVPSLSDLLSAPSSLSLVPPRLGQDAEATGSGSWQADTTQDKTNSTGASVIDCTTKSYENQPAENLEVRPYFGKSLLESVLLKEKCKALTKRIEKLLPNRRFFCMYCGWRFKDVYQFMKHKRSHIKYYRRVKGNATCKQMRSEDNPSRMPTKMGFKMYACSICDRSFKEIHTMKTHERSHANHTCHYCGRVFASSTARIVHERAHTGERPYQCDECSKGFRTSYMRTRHKQQCHNTERPFKCEYCNKRFKVRNAMTTHMKTHTHEKNLPCPVCSKNFGLPRDLLRHMKTHTDERPFQCEYCQKSYKQKSTLTTHIQKHFVGNFACQYCPLKFRTPQAHARHESIHTGIKPVFKRVEKPFPCRYCDRVFPRNVKRKIHERVHTGELPFQCELCERAYSSKKGLESHMRTHSDERPYPCLVCGKSFKERNTLKCHMRIHTGVRPFKCEQCDKTFRVSDALKKHRRSHSDERAYKCQQCEKAFKQLSALRKHERWHLGLRPHICDICGRDFVDRYRLRIHQSIHLEVRPHKCNMCDKSFTEACRLKRHMKDHENRRDFECEICGKKFNFKDQLDTHVKTHSSERPYQCQNCPKCFKNSSALHRHQRVHSNQTFRCPVCSKCFKFMRSLKKHAMQHLGSDMMPFDASTSFADLCGVMPLDSESSTGNENASSGTQRSSEDRRMEVIQYANHLTDQDSQSNTDLRMYPKSLGMYPEESHASDSDQSTIVDEAEPKPDSGIFESSVLPKSSEYSLNISPLSEIKTERCSEDE